MAEGDLLVAGEGWRTAARDFVPESHRDLPMLRVFLPFIDRDGDVVRWSRYVDLELASASLDWFEATARAAQDDPAVRDRTSCMGILDAATADALREAMGDLRFRCLRWVGYAEGPHPGTPRRVFGEEYGEADLSRKEVIAGCRVPEFVWDADARLAWGGRLYPDSLIVAAELPIFRRLRNDPRLDSVSLHASTDILPRSAGD